MRKKITQYRAINARHVMMPWKVWVLAILNMIAGALVAVIVITSQEQVFDPTIPITPTLREVTPDMLPNRVISFSSPNAEKCMALNIYHEARGEPFVGKVAVADVVLNRTKDSRSPDTVCAVVYEGLRGTSGTMYLAKCQFSWYCDGKSDEPKDDVAWQESLNIAQQMLSAKENSYRGVTEGATHYHTYDIPPPLWTKNRDVRMVGRIGDHIFYRWQ
jgi:N-acetylmuramoyl-L-alanine amidase